MRSAISNRLTFDEQVNLGLWPEARFVEKFGRNSDLTINSVPEDVWDLGGLYTGFPEESETVDIVSTSTADASGGAGALSVTISGLGDDWLPASETVALTGTVAVTSGQLWRRVNRVFVETAGSSGANVGDITVAHTTTTANVFASVPAGQGQTTIAAFTVAAGYVAVVSAMSILLTRTSGAAGSAVVSLRAREPGTGSWRSRLVFDVTTGFAVYQDTAALVFPEKTDLVVRVDDVSDNATACNSHLDILEFLDAELALDR